MELKRIIARDSRSANEKAMALYGPDVLVIANHSVDGQTELIVAIDIEPHAPASLVREEPGASFQAMEPARVLAPWRGLPALSGGQSRELPWVLFASSDGHVLFEGPLPQSAGDLVELVKRHTAAD